MPSAPSSRESLSLPPKATNMTTLPVVTMTTESGTNNTIII